MMIWLSDVSCQDTIKIGSVLRLILFLKDNPCLNSVHWGMFFSAKRKHCLIKGFSKVEKNNNEVMKQTSEKKVLCPLWLNTAECICFPLLCWRIQRAALVAMLSVNRGDMLLLRGPFLEGMSVARWILPTISSNVCFNEPSFANHFNLKMYCP